MPDNLTRQILRKHLVDGELTPASPISIRMDQALLQDATGTMALMQFEELGEPRIKVERAVQYVDHNVVQLDFKNPDDHRMLQALARKYGLHFSRPGNGISHYIHMERFGKPGQTMLGADSHTTQAGCLGMVAIGAGGLDVAVVLGGHPYEIACPEVVEVRLEGKLARPWVQAKDIILELLRRLTASWGKNKVLEFTGPGTHDLSIPERATIANMIADMGGTAGVFPPDETTRDWLLRQQRHDDFVEVGPDDCAQYDDRIEIDLGELGPLVAKPHNPDNVVPVEEGRGNPDRPGLHRLVGQLWLQRPRAPRRGARRPRRADRAPVDCRDRDARVASDPGRDRGIGRVPPTVRRRRADARARVRTVRGHGPGASVGVELAADVQPELPGPVGHTGGLGVPVLARFGGGLAAERQDRGSALLWGTAGAVADARAAPLRRGRPHLRAGGG